MELTYFIHPLTGETKKVLTPGDVPISDALLTAIDVSIARWHWAHNIVSPFALRSIHIALESEIVICGDTPCDQLEWREGLSSRVQLNQKGPLREIDTRLGHELDVILHDYITMGVHHGDA